MTGVIAEQNGRLDEEPFSIVGDAAWRISTSLSWRTRSNSSLWSANA